MNAEQLLGRTNRRTAILAAMTLALAVTTSIAALAGPPSKPAREARSTVVSLADLDLSTPEGLDAARDRVRQASKQLCRLVADPDDLSRYANYNPCVKESFTTAMERANKPALGVVARSDAASGNAR